MVSAKQLLDSGRLDEAVAEVIQTVRDKPLDGRARIFLFELLCFQGEFDRATRQLEVLASQSTDVGVELAVRAYINLVAAETARRQVFHGAGLPMFLVPPPAHIEQYLLFVKKLGEGASDIGEVLERAEDATPEVRGTRAGQAFGHFRDADDRVSPFLEVLSGADYLWVPFCQIRRITVNTPTRLRELMWVPVTLEACELPPREVFVPALYVDSSKHPNGEVRLGRMTTWDAFQDRVVIGTGQRVFLADDRELSLLELGDVEFADVPVSTTPSS